jgi:septal ring factor EnvC (AmiA/AmiB activator)
MPTVERRSRAPRVRRTRLIAVASGAVALAVVGGVLTAPLSASAYPSWSDVQAAKGNASATKKQVDAITADLTSLRDTATAKSNAAIQANAANAQAQSQLAAATSTANALDDQLAAEKKKADEAHTQAGQLAARLYRMGGSSQLDGQLFSGSQATSTLYKLGALAQLTRQWQTVLDEATVTSKSVASLSDQATVAQKERDTRAGQAQTALAAAQSAQAEADAAVSTASSHQSTLEAQLASLDKQAAAVLVGYKNGVMAHAIVVQQEKDKAAAAAKAAAALKAKQNQNNNTAAASSSGSGTSAGSGSTGASAPVNLGGGVVDDPAGAQAYASSQLGAHGWASSQMSCLVSLWNQESGWRTDALNVSSGAYGIPQSLPADKMAGYGLDWQTNYRTQINWGLAYISAAYGSPCGAWAHEVSHNWY